MQRAMNLNSETQLDKKQVSSLFETAETIQINALNLARRKLLPGERDMQLAKVLERQEFVEKFKRALAQEIAHVIAAYDQRVQAVYLIGETINTHKKPEEELLSVDLNIRLFTLVTTASAALLAFVASLDRALTIVLGELPSKAFGMGNSFLEVVPITERDIEHGWGYALLFSSIYGRPTEIWQRD